MRANPLPSPLPPWPERFNLEAYFLERNLEAGRGKKVALVEGERRRTFAELGLRVRRLTAWMRANGLRPEERVLIVLLRRLRVRGDLLRHPAGGRRLRDGEPAAEARGLRVLPRYTKARFLVTEPAVLEELGDPRRASRTLSDVLLVGGAAAAASRLRRRPRRALSRLDRCRARAHRSRRSRRLAVHLGLDRRAQGLRAHAFRFRLHRPRPMRCRSRVTARTTCASRFPSSSSATRRGRT